MVNNCKKVSICEKYFLPPKFCYCIYNQFMWYYKEITCERDVTKSNFPNGVIKFIYRMPANLQINLSKSFIRSRIQITNADANRTQISLDSVLAPSYLLGHNLFKQMYHSINGTCVSEIRSYVSQVAALKNRLNENKEWRDRFIGSTNFGKISFDARLNDIASYGLNTQNLTWSSYNPNLTKGKLPHWLDRENQYECKAATSSVEFTAGAGAPIIDLSAVLSIGDIIGIDDGIDSEYKIITGFLPPDDNTAKTSIVVAGGINNNGAADVEDGVWITDVQPNRTVSKSKRSKFFEIAFQPPMGIWETDTWLPSHDMELCMYPHPEGTWQRNAIESIGSVQQIPAPEDNATYNISIEDMILYVCVMNKKHENGKFKAEYEDVRCQIQNITTTSNVDYQFVVDSDAYKFTLAFQDENAENDTRLPSTFFKIRNEEELKLKRYYLQYNGMILPNPYPSLTKTVDTDLFVQRYFESIYYSNADETKDVESFLDWQTLGPYYTHTFGKSNMKTERLTVSTLFENNAFADNHRPNILIFDHFIRQYSLSVNNGRVTEVTADLVN